MLNRIQFTDEDRPVAVHTPVSVVHLALAVACLALAMAVAALTGGDTSNFAGNFTPLILSIPRWLLDATLGSLQVSLALAAVIGVLGLLFTTRFRRLACILLA